jgi:hypothetical protein
VRFALFPANWLEAQSSTGTIRGQITDPSGAVIPNAAITAAAGQTFPATSDNAGAYVIRGLPPGNSP